MGFDGDYSLWKSFRETVKKLDRSNLLIPELPKKSNKSIVHEVDIVVAVLDSRIPRKHLKVEPLPKAEMKKFIPRFCILVLFLMIITWLIVSTL